LSVAFVVVAAWDIGRSFFKKGQVSDRDILLANHRELRARFEAHEKAQAELMVDWQLALTDIRQKLEHVTKEARSEVAGTLAAAAQGGTKWR
jgi:hypothetical protein